MGKIQIQLILMMVGFSLGSFSEATDESVSPAPENVTLKTCADRQESDQEFIDRGRVSKKFSPTYFYHVANSANVASIREYGLLSTELLLTLASVPNNEHEEILRQHRQEDLVLPNGIIIRDQKPMPPAALKKVLPQDMTPSDWYRLLNTFVFLWPDKARAKSHWRACGSVPDTLLVFDAQKILNDFGLCIFLSPINSGYALRCAAKRSPALLVPYQEWIKTGWTSVMGKVRSPMALPAEILIKESLSLDTYLVSIE